MIYLRLLDVVMQYQLPNGKVVYLSIEEYLNLTDQDVQYLMAMNCGDYVNNPFQGSVINKGVPKTPTSDDDIMKDIDDDELRGLDLNDLDNLDDFLK